MEVANYRLSTDIYHFYRLLDNIAMLIAKRQMKILSLEGLVGLNWYIGCLVMAVATLDLIDCRLKPLGCSHKCFGSSKNALRWTNCGGVGWNEMSKLGVSIVERCGSHEQSADNNQ